jgi:hypothetical protein
LIAEHHGEPTDRSIDRLGVDPCAIAQLKPIARLIPCDRY